MKSLNNFYTCLKGQKPHFYDFVDRNHWDFIFFMGYDSIPLVTIRPLTQYGNLMLQDFWAELEAFIASHHGSLSCDRHLLEREETPQLSE